MAKSSAQYEVLMKDMVDTYSLELNSVFDFDEFQSNMLLIDKKNRMRDDFLKRTFITDYVKSKIQTNTEDAQKDIREYILKINSIEELNSSSFKPPYSNENVVEDYILNQKFYRIRALAAAKSVITRHNLLKKSLFANPEQTVIQGRYMKWSSLSRFYHLTDEELSQLQRDNPDIDLG